MLRLPTKKIKEIINWHEKTKTPYRVKFTNQRIVFNSKISGTIMNKESQFPADELYFLRLVKDTIIKEELYKKVPNRFRTEESRNKIKYFEYHKGYAPGTSLTNCFEIDMKSAYWETAYRLGILPRNIYTKATPISWESCLKNELITNTTYEKCKSYTHKKAYKLNLIDKPLYKKIKGISKASRLAAIGTLAKTVREYEFDGKKQIRFPTKRSKLTEHLWHTICHKVGKIMNEIAKKLGKEFVFFWVDAMFVKDEKSLKIVKSIFKKHGYGCEIEPCKLIVFTTDKIVVWGKGKWVEVDGKRTWKEDRPFPYEGPTDNNKIT